MAPPSGPRTTPLCIWGAVLGATLLVPHLRPAAVFLLPGLLIHAIPGVMLKGPISALAKTVASSIAFWVIAVWVASWVGVNLSTLFWVVTPTSAVLWLVILARKTRPPAVFPTGPVQVIALALAFVLTMLPFVLTLAPPGADMSMHGYITRMVYESGGVPETYQPYLPIEEFGAFSIGFHTLAAQAATVSGGALALHRAVLLIDCLVYFLLFLFLMGALRLRFNSWTTIACASVAMFATRNPQHFIAWGGTPTVLSIGLIACALPALTNPRDSRRADVCLCAFWLAAAFWCHPLPTIILGAVYLPYAGYLIGASIKTRDVSRLLRRYAAIVAIGLVCTSLFLVKFDNRMSEDEMEWIKTWDTMVKERWRGTVLDSPITLTQHLTQYALGFLTIPLGFAMLLAVFSKRKEDRINLYFVLALAAIVINGKYQMLPKSMFLFPDRAEAMVPIFAAPLIGSLLVSAKNTLAAIISEHHVRRLSFLCLLAVACISIGGSYGYYLRPGLAEAQVTTDDIRTFNWIESHTDPDAYIANNYSDAGIFLPMMTRRRITVPHVNIVNWSETKIQVASKPARYLYLGVKSVYPVPFEWTSAVVEALKPRPQLIFQSGGARLYELDPTLADAISADFERLVASKGKASGKINLLRPADGELLTAPRIVLEWDPSDCDLFNVQLSLSPNFDNPLPVYNSYPAIRPPAGALDITPLGPLMPTNTPIYWRVRGLHSTRTTLFESPIRYFIRG